MNNEAARIGIYLIGGIMGLTLIIMLIVYFLGGRR
jgi:hypothetical protein